MDKFRGLIFTGELVPGVMSGAITMFSAAMKHPGNGMHYNKLLCDWALSGDPHQFEADEHVWHWMGKTQRPAVGEWVWELQTDVDDSALSPLPCPFRVGEKRYVKEVWATRADLSHVEYRASHQEPAELPFGHIYDEQTRWKSPMFMPRRYARTWIEILSVKPARCQDITTEEIRESMGGLLPTRYSGTDASSVYSALWDRLNSKRGFPWSGNWWVWRLTFRLTEAPC